MIDLEKENAKFLKKKKLNAYKPLSGLKAATEQCFKKAKETPATPSKEHQPQDMQQLLDKFYIPKRYQGAKVKDMIKRDPILIKYFSPDIFLKALNAGRGLILCGQYGRAKTRLAFAAAREFIIANVDNKKTKYPVFVTFQEIINNIAIDQEWRKYLEMLFKAHFLIIDDFMSIDITARESGLLTELFGKRYWAMKPIMLNANLDPSALEKKCGERMWERLKYVNYIKELKGESLRKKYDEFTLDDLT